MNRDGEYSVTKPSTIPRDATAALVTAGRAYGTYAINKLLEVPIDIWREVTNQGAIEQEIIARNRRHLQQIEREQGVTEGPLLKEIHANYGINPSAKAILAGTYETTYEISEEQAAWFRAVKQTEKEKNAPAVLGSLDMGQYRQTFKAAQDRTSSSPARLHYTIW